MRLALTQTKTRISKLVKQMQPQSSHKLLFFYVIFVVLRSHFCPIFFSKYILCNALFLLLTKQNGGAPTFLENLKRVATKKRLGTTDLDESMTMRTEVKTTKCFSNTCFLLLLLTVKIAVTAINF